MNDKTESPAAFVPFPVPTAPAPTQFGTYKWASDDTEAAEGPAEPVPPRRKGRPPKAEKVNLAGYPLTTHREKRQAKKTRKPRADKHALGEAAVKMGLARTRRPRAIKSKDEVATGMKFDAVTLLNASANLDHGESAVLCNMILELARLSKSARPRVLRALASLFPE